MALNLYHTTVDLFQIASQELDPPRIMKKHFRARDPFHLDTVIRKDFEKYFGVNYVEFFYSAENLSIRY